MGVAITFRHMDSSEAIKTYAKEKLERVQKYLHVPLNAQVTLFQERHQFVAEVHISASGRQYHARHDSDEMYKSIDLVADKIQHQITKAHDSATKHHKDKDKAALMAAESAALADDNVETEV
jgi:putative sigma-54 modulation protein